MSSFPLRPSIQTVVLMSGVIALLGCVSTGHHISATPTAATSGQVTGQADNSDVVARSELIAKIVGMAASDQYERNLLIGSQQDQNLTPQQKEAAASRYQTLLNQRDGERLTALKAILAKTSLTQLAQMDGQAAGSALLMVIHADEGFQRSLLGEVTALAKAKKISSNQATTFTDKLAIGEGKPQVYGTQVSCSSRNGGPLTWGATGLEPDAALDERRAAIGLEPFASYLANFPRVYGPCTEAWVVKPAKK